MGEAEMHKDPFDLTGRVALITGASSHGIGNSSAKLLAAHGAKVFLTARRQEKLQQAMEEIESAGGVAAYRPTDVSSEEECAAAVKACVDTFGRLDIMVLSAGTSGLSASGGYDAVFDSENWRTVQSINLDGVFFMVKYGARECAKHGCGSIIPVGSLASWHYSGSAAYTATKGALRSLVQYFGHMLAPDVRVNGIYPGLTDTDMTHPATEHPQFGKMLLSNIPMGRFGTPEDIANGVLYLASDASSFMTGQHLVVDGGELA
ncbi:MAG: SDR family NAD(P)-dependent oxidoreductase [Eggerthellaceae bacterium]|jgi:meso-butanediol dehydrogenase/(S,S)-butanediol dehydrogenase/diacetyl reductase